MKCAVAVGCAGEMVGAEAWAFESHLQATQGGPINQTSEHVAAAEGGRMVMRVMRYLAYYEMHKSVRPPRDDGV